VTNDHAERDTVISLGGLASSCENFIDDLEQTLANMADDIQDYNRREQHRFRNRR
jgi:predicted RNA-binding protein with PIN domain